MSTQLIRHPEAAVLHELAVLLAKTARRIGTAAQDLDAWLEARRLALHGFPERARRRAPTRR